MSGKEVIDGIQTLHLNTQFFPVSILKHFSILLQVCTMSQYLTRNS